MFRVASYGFRVGWRLTRNPKLVTFFYLVLSGNIGQNLKSGFRNQNGMFKLR